MFLAALPGVGCDLFELVLDRHCAAPDDAGDLTLYESEDELTRIYGPDAPAMRWPLATIVEEEWST